MVGLDSVSFVRILFLTFFGRAGGISTRANDRLLLYAGAMLIVWSGVAATAQTSELLHFKTGEVYVHYGDSYPSGYPLRCLAHGTAG